MVMDVTGGLLGQGLRKAHACRFKVGGVVDSFLYVTYRVEGSSARTKW